MKDLEKSGYVKWLCGVIASNAESYESDAHEIYFDYDGVIDILDQAKTLIMESARCPRPDSLPMDMAWDERLADSDSVFNPYAYTGTMEYEDYAMASAACLADDWHDESRDWEP